MDDQSRNLILATALSFLVILGWFVLGPILFPNAFPPPTEQTDRRRTEATGRAAAPAPPAATRGARRPSSPRRPGRRAKRRWPKTAAGADRDRRGSRGRCR